MPAIKKYDSGFSETATTISSSTQHSETLLEHIYSFEKIYYEHLKQYIIKYSRPLRRYLNPDEIVDLFQNIEKVSEVCKGDKAIETAVLNRFPQFPNPFFVNVKNYSMVKICPTYPFPLFINHGYDRLL